MHPHVRYGTSNQFGRPSKTMHTPRPEKAGIHCGERILQGFAQRCIAILDIEPLLFERKMRTHRSFGSLSLSLIFALEGLQGLLYLPIGLRLQCPGIFLGLAKDPVGTLSRIVQNLLCQCLYASDLFHALSFFCSVPY